MSVVELPAITFSHPLIQKPLYQTTQAKHQPPTNLDPSSPFLGAANIPTVLNPIIDPAPHNLKPGADEAPGVQQSQSIALASTGDLNIGTKSKITTTDPLPHAKAERNSTSHQETSPRTRSGINPSNQNSDRLNRELSPTSEADVERALEPAGSTSTSRTSSFPLQPPQNAEALLCKAMDMMDQSKRVSEHLITLIDKTTALSSQVPPPPSSDALPGQSNQSRHSKRKNEGKKVAAADVSNSLEDSSIAAAPNEAVATTPVVVAKEEPSPFMPEPEEELNICEFPPGLVSTIIG